MKYFVYTKIENREYMVTVDSTSLCSAEHELLDNIYGCSNALAFEAKYECMGDAFIGWMLNATTISYRELHTIQDRVRTEKLIQEIQEKELEIEKLRKEVDELYKKQWVLN